MGNCGGGGEKKPPAKTVGAGRTAAPARAPARAPAPAPASGQKPLPSPPTAPSPRNDPDSPMSPGKERLRRTFPGYEALDEAAARHQAAARRVEDLWEGEDNLISVSQYVVDRCIAVGGQAAVWLVHHKGYEEEKRVLKAYSKESLEQEKERDGLKNATAWYEFEILSKIGKGCDAIPVMDEVLLSDSTVYLVMEYVEGPTLRDRVLESAHWRRRRPVKYSFTVPPDGRLGLTLKGTTIDRVNSAAAQQAGRVSEEGPNGFVEGQRLCSIDGSDVISLEDVVEAVKKLTPGEEVTIVVSELNPAPGGEPDERFDPKETFRSLAKVIRYIHDFGIAHRDLKPENLILKVKDGQAVVHLVDFGCGAQVASALPRKADSRLSSSLNDVPHSDSGGQAIPAKRMPSVLLTRPTGTKSYLSPEVIKTYSAVEQAERSGKAVADLSQEHKYRGRPYDIWMVGALLFELLTNKLLFGITDDEDDASNWVSIDNSLDTPKATQFQRLEPGAKDLLRKCLARDVSDRPTALGILQHPWLSKKAADV
eukprot:Hpha_TRINITY_DN13432_c0_g1::TRINITY_DN13432_c0_g1_i1::g.131023::m.131023